MIYIINDALSNDDIEHLTKDWTSHNFIDNSDNHGDVGRKKSSTFDYKHHSHTDICNYFWNKITPKASTYLVKRLSQPYLVWYRESDYYNWHMDAFPCGGVASHYSFTCFLNEPDEYDGGELVLDIGGKEIEIKEPKGTCVLYNTGVRHKVNEILSGDRKVIVGWGESLVINSKMREILTELQLFLNDEKSSITMEQYERLDNTRLNLLREYANL